MLDEKHSTPRGCTDVYTCGRIGQHNVVIAGLPKGQPGTHSATATAMQMIANFASIRFGLMVGVGGGVPSPNDVRLGDVVVSTPLDTFGGVVQYDFGKAMPNGHKRTGTLNAPPQVLLNAVAEVDAAHLRRNVKFLEHLSKLKRSSPFVRGNAGSDALYNAAYDHKGGETCEQCDTGYLVAREPREEDVKVHYGTIASGNQVIRSAAERDRVSAELGGVLCFEMEAAGLMNNFPCIVIRGICDYADSHKNKRWQPYAAATAAAYAKEVMSVIPATEVAKSPLSNEVIVDNRHGLTRWPRASYQSDSRYESRPYTDAEMVQAWRDQLRMEDRCFRCGTRGSHYAEHCRASDKRVQRFCEENDLCFRCSDPGHYSNECWLIS